MVEAASVTTPDLYVFDLDGTLVDSLPDIADALNHAMTEAHFAARTLLEIRAFLGDGARELVRRAVGPAPSEDALTELVAAYRARYRTALVNKTRPYPGVLATLPQLRAPAAVLTNKPGPEAREIVLGTGMSAWLPKVVGEGDGLPRKPDPESLRTLVRNAGSVRPLYVGDSAVDEETAARAGVDFVFVSFGYGEASAAARRVARFEELLLVQAASAG